MGFYDINTISRKRLDDVVKYSKPYRDSEKSGAPAYPVGDRRYSGRHFRVMPNGEYHIFYAHREHMDNRVQKQDIPQYALMGVVHEDNTFEFRKAFCQSTVMYLHEALNAFVAHRAKLGGAVYRRRDEEHPVFQGLRVNIDTGVATTPYQTFHRRLNQKVAKQEMEKYQEFIAVYSAMNKAMDSNAIIDVCQDMYEQFGKDAFDHNNATTAALALIDQKKYLDAGILFSLYNGTNYRQWYLERYLEDPADTNWGKPEFRKGLPLPLKAFRDKVLRSKDHVFVEKEVPMGDPLPSSTWGLRVVRDGQQVVRL